MSLNKDSKFLFFGGLGFIGECLTKKLIEKGYNNITVVSKNVSQSIYRDKINLIEATIKICSYKRLIQDADYIINFIPSYIELDKLIIEYSNAILIHLGTRLQFDKQEIELNEQSITNPQNEYAKNKNCSEILYKDANGILIRIANVYGPSGNFLRKKTLDTYILKPLFKNQVLNIDIPIDTFKDMLYLKDFLAAIILIFENSGKCKGQCFVVGSGEKVTIGEIIEIAKENFPDAKINYNPKKNTSIESFTCNSNKLNVFTSWNAKTSFRKGFINTINTLRSISQGSKASFN